MEAAEREAIIRETEERVRMEIARKMQEDRLSVQTIRKYTGIELDESPRQAPQYGYDLTAKQVACEMLMRGLPIDAIATATGVPYPVLRELRSQMPD